jgi:hypothetical protein
MFSWQLDGTLMYQAAAAGFAFKEFDGHPTYHLEHSAGWSIESQSALFERLEREGIPVLTEAGGLDVAYSMWKTRKHHHWLMNLQGWGRVAEDLPESNLETVRRAAHRVS